jgi:hypothetical protein
MRVCGDVLTCGVDVSQNDGLRHARADDEEAELERGACGCAVWGCSCSFATVVVVVLLLMMLMMMMTIAWT